MTLARVLVVEDEFLVGSMVLSALERADFEVVGPVESCAQAHAMLDRGDIDFVTLDLTLRNGELSVPVARRLEALGVPYLLVTGNLGHAVAEEHGISPSKVLDKPFSIKDLIRSAQEMLSAEDKTA